MKPIQIRQGDVFLLPIADMPVPLRGLPAGCKQIEPEKGTRFVLAHGEVTGHAHAIYEFTDDQMAEQELAKAAEIGTAALERARTRRTVQLWAAPDGEWYLEVREASVMRHEEHDAPTIPKGVYHCPVQVEAGPDNMPRLVAD